MKKLSILILLISQLSFSQNNIATFLITSNKSEVSRLFNQVNSKIKNHNDTLRAGIIINELHTETNKTIILIKALLKQDSLDVQKTNVLITHIANLNKFYTEYKTADPLSLLKKKAITNSDLVQTALVLFQNEQVVLYHFDEIFKTSSPFFIEYAIICENKHIASGDFFQAKINILSSQNTISNIKVFVNGKEYTVTDGQAKIQFKVIYKVTDRLKQNEKGFFNQKWKGFISFTRKGRNEKIAISGEYYMVKPVAQLMNGTPDVLYKNSDNYIDVIIPALGASYKPTFTIKHPKVNTLKKQTQTLPSQVIITPTESKISLSIYHNSIFISKANFHVINVPNPSITLYKKESKPFQEICKKEKRTNRKGLPYAIYSKLQIGDVLEITVTEVKRKTANGQKITVDMDNITFKVLINE